ncbi:MAG: DUF2937 family protein [Parachlamydia sp.]|jgi:hypothetical protein|nr:DUF2937 family protein [Parachlamydia sp.]
MKCLNLLFRLLDRFVVVLFVLIGSQCPAFMHQYLQRLAGHANEAAYQVQLIGQMAAVHGKIMPDYIAKFLLSGDPDFVLQGSYMEGLVARSQRLNASLLSIEGSPLWERPFVFLKELDSSIAQKTYQSFQPGFNLTMEGLAYSLAGLLIGYLFCRLIFNCCRLLFNAICCFCLRRWQSI